ncbi:MAG TPA: FG-GAP repeat protein [Bryobacteraceae bacterium]|nr:FG-GAP repeat protein [Bryobacteraceae bacterium]
MRSAPILIWMLAAAPAHAQFVQQGGKLTINGNGTFLGNAVATSADGNTAIAGEPGDNASAGAALVFTRTNGAWSQQAKLTASDAASNPGLGLAVAMSADGNTAIVGGPNDNSNQGAAWVFTRNNNGVWAQQGPKLVGSGSSAFAFQGFSVGLSADGNTAIVGGPTDNSSTGAAWIFSRNSSGAWTPMGGKLAPGGASGYLGHSVAISGDGNTAMAGAYFDSNGIGAAWVFTRSGSAWVQQGGKLVGSGASGTASQGSSVALSFDGNTALVGGTGDNGSLGAAWVFTRTSGQWTQQGSKLAGSDTFVFRLFGTSVSLSAGGNTALIGGPGGTTAQNGCIGSSHACEAGAIGATWVFTRSGGAWSQQGSDLIGTGSATNDVLQGTSVALSGDGSTAIVGGPFDNSRVGALWIFTQPVAVGTPAVASLAPVASSGSSQMLTVTYNAPGGYQTLGVVNVLINNFLDGRQACYLAYSQPSNMLFIVPDNGDGSQLTGTLMNGTGTLSNSQCTVTLNGSSASGAGNTLTLTLNLSFTSSFGGNKVVYAAARDIAQNNSGWQTMGVHGVPPLPSTFPNPVSMSPSSGNSLTATITFSYQDQNTAANLQTVWALVNTAIDGRAACYVAYYRPGNQLYLYPDNGDGAAATNIVLTGSNTISNSQCTVSALGSQVQTNGSTLNVTLAIAFKPAFAGFKGVWMAAQTMGAAETSAWQALGAEAVPGQ